MLRGLKFCTNVKLWITLENARTHTRRNHIMQSEWYTAVYIFADPKSQKKEKKKSTVYVAGIQIKNYLNFLSFTYLQLFWKMVETDFIISLLAINGEW